MMRYFILALLTVMGLSAQAKMPSALPTTPDGYTLLTKVTGDLNRDGVDELVLVFNTPNEFDSDGGLGTVREIDIYQQKNNLWQLWHKSVGAILPSDHGGMMGDPFQDFRIERGAIVVEHFGGSRDKWHYTHRYRFQNNNWFLIGAHITYVAPCDFEREYDYNLTTGRLDVHETQYDLNSSNCDKFQRPTVFSITRKIKPVLMYGFYPGNNEVKIPKLKNGSFYY